MADHNLPTLTSLYAEYTTQLKARIDDCLKSLDPAYTLPTNVPTDAIRFSSAAKKWQRWDGAAWGSLVDSYDIHIDGNAATATVASSCSGNAATATNLVAGSANQVMYKNSSGANTGSSGLIYNGTNFTCGGNITAYSDETLKTDWQELPADFVSRLAKVKYGVYSRTDLGVRQAGCSAQDWQQLLPEVVSTTVGGKLALAYANAALVSAVALAKEVTELRQELAELKKGKV